LLADGADIEERGGPGVAGRTPLFAAALGGHTDILLLLLEHGADVSVADDDGWTSLHIAAFLGREKVVRLLLEYGADVSAENMSGKTP
ncbi:ankyrin repeat-containing domain protein, partial [Baffinella frigidus]